MLKNIGLLANLKIDVHTHMLRHSTGYTLANKGTDTRTLQHFLGHKNIQNTVIYTEMSAERFKDISGYATIRDICWIRVF